VGEETQLRVDQVHGTVNPEKTVAGGSSRVEFFRAAEQGVGDKGRK